MSKNELDNLIDLSAAGDGAALLDEDAFAADTSRTETAPKRPSRHRKDTAATAERPADTLDPQPTAADPAPPTPDNRGYVNLTEEVGEAAGEAGDVVAAAAAGTADAEHVAPSHHLEQACAPTRHPERAGAPTRHPEQACAPTRHPEQAGVPLRHPERAKRVEGSSQNRAEGAHASSRLAYRVVKRAFDIAFSLCAIALLLVPSIVLCIAIRIESPGNPIYSQKRVGRIGKDGEVETFSMYKFRSMCRDADERLAELRALNEADGPLFKIKDDPRVTRIGRFIRRHSIDELPQFTNCLLGQLSVVGPRPPLPHEVAQYDERALRRLSVKPGLTGYWQVSGRSDTSFEDMVDLDLKYIEECGVQTDLKVILKTVAVVFTGKGAC